MEKRIGAGVAPNSGTLPSCNNKRAHLHLQVFEH